MRACTVHSCMHSSMSLSCKFDTEQLWDLQPVLLNVLGIASAPAFVAQSATLCLLVHLRREISSAFRPCWTPNRAYMARLPLLAYLRSPEFVKTFWQYVFELLAGSSWYSKHGS